MSEQQLSEFQCQACEKTIRFYYETCLIECPYCAQTYRVIVDEGEASIKAVDRTPAPEPAEPKSIKEPVQDDTREPRKHSGQRRGAGAAKKKVKVRSRQPQRAPVKRKSSSGVFAFLFMLALGGGIYWLWTSTPAKTANQGDVTSAENIGANEPVPFDNSAAENTIDDSEEEDTTDSFAEEPSAGQVKEEFRVVDEEKEKPEVFGDDEEEEPEVFAGEEEEPTVSRSSSPSYQSSSKDPAVDDRSSYYHKKRAQGENRLVELEFDTEDLVPVIAYDVTASPYNADKSGKKDCTRAFNDALRAAGETGGTVFAPSGKYRFDGEIEIPWGVTLRGDWKRPTSTNAIVDGTVFLVYAGQGNEDGTPFVTAKLGGMRDVSIFYPEQSIRKVLPYPVTVHLDESAAIKNVTLVNAYRGVLTGGFSTIMNLYGTTLDTGVTMLQAAAVPRCRNVQLSPRYWSESGFSGAPSLKNLRQTMISRKAYAIQLNRQDAGIFMDLKIDGYHTGVKFMPPHGWTYWHNMDIKDVEVGIDFVGGSNQRGTITGSTIKARKYGVLMQMNETGWDKALFNKISKSGKPFGLPKDIGNLHMFDCSIESDGSGIYMDGSFKQKLNLQECTLTSWGNKEDDWAINAVSGDVIVYDSEFKKSKHHILLQKESQKQLLEIVGNKFSGRKDLQLPKVSGAKIDHDIQRKSNNSMRPIQQVPEMLPARIGSNAIYIVTESPYNTPNDGTKDASAGLQKALTAAGKAGGGTVFLPQGSYRITKHLKVPAGVEFRGINDFMPRGEQSRTLLIADLPKDWGSPDNPPFITLESSKKLGGSGVAGLAIWYPHQDYRDIKPYPWTIRSKGPACWVNRVYLGNCYNAVDFASADNDRHVLSRVCGSALNIAFRVGHSPTIGWIDNCHIRPQDWSISSQKPKRKKKKNGKPEFVFEIPGDQYARPTKDDIFRGTKYSLIPNMRGAGVITVGSGANVQVTAFFTNGATRAFDFVDHDGTGGGSANVLIGGSEAGWGAWIKALGKNGLTLVNFSFNPMTRLDYVTANDIPPGNLPKGMAMRVEKKVSSRTPITFIMPKFYGRKDIDIGAELLGGDVYFKQGILEGDYGTSLVDTKGGKFNQRNTKAGEEE